MKPPWWTATAVPREDVVWCYRNLLGREPESEGAVRAHSGVGGFKELVERFARSPELLARAGSATAGNGFSGAGDARRKILIMGNCQVNGLAKLVQAMPGDAVAAPLELTAAADGPAR